MSWLVRLVLLLAVVLPHDGWMLAQAAETLPSPGGPIRFRMGAQGPVARLVLESDRPFAMTRSDDGDDLVLRFGRTLQGDTKRIPVVLTDAILSASTRGETMRLRLRHRIGLQARQASPERMILEFREEPGAPDGHAAGDVPPTSRNLPALLTEDPLELPTGTLRRTPETAAAQLADETAGPRPDLGGDIGLLEAPLAAAPVPRTILTVSADVLDTDVVALSYRWDQQVRAAIFQRDDRLWLFFAAQPQQIVSDPVALARSLGVRVQDAERQVLREGLVFRLQLAPGVQARLAPPAVQGGTGVVWRLLLGPHPATSENLVPPPPLDVSDGALRFAAAGPAAVLSDPRAGDRLILLPVDSAHAAPSPAGALPDLEVLSTLAGFVLRPLRPDIVMEPDGDGLLVGRADPFSLTLADRPQPASTEPRLGFVRFRDVDLQARRSAQAALASLPGDPGRQAALIRLLLAQDLVTEARAVAAASDADRPEIAWLGDVVDVLTDPTNVAPDRFAAPLPADAAEAALWRAHLYAVRGAWNLAADALARSGDTLRHYPPALRKILVPSVVGAVIAAGRTDAALATLDGLSAVPADDGERAVLKLLQGRALAEEDAVGAARRKLAEAMAAGDAEVSMAARGSVIGLDLEQGVLDAVATNQELRERAPAWEASSQEREMEELRARVAAAAGDWPTALAAGDRAALLPSLHAENGPPLVRHLLAQALAAPDLDTFQKLDLLRGRSLAQLRDPLLEVPLRALARELAELDQPATARAVLTAAALPLEEPRRPPPPPEHAMATAPAATELTRRLADLVEAPERALSDRAPELQELLRELAVPSPIAP